ncbi:MAG TPA: cytochrome P450 [Solirubrobacteraceae bacterium]
MLPPGPSTPGLFNLAVFAMRPLETLLGWQRRYGNVFKVNFTGFGDGVYVAEPDAIQELFTGDQSDMHAGEANSILEPVLGPNSVLVLDGPEHLRQRRLLLPPFQGARINTFREVIRDATEREVAGWAPGAELVMRERMRALTFDVICRAVFGVTEPVRVERLREALVQVIDSSNIYMVSSALRKDLGPWSPGGRLARRLRNADALLYEEIALRRREPDLEERTDVLSLLLCARDEEGRAMTDAELRDELFTMLGAGHETTATALSFAFELLLRTPGAYARLRDEIEAGNDAYVDAVERTLVSPRRVAGYDLPKGMKIYPAIALTHLREDLYPQAHEFRPERFLEGATSYTWLPFGGGIRRCIGAALAQTEIAEALKVIVPRVDLQPLRDKPDPVILRGVTLAPRYGVHVRVLRSAQPAKSGGEMRLTPSASA